MFRKKKTGDNSVKNNGGKSKSNKKNNLKYKQLDELVLKNAKLRFCGEQLQNLNFIFQKRLQKHVPSASEKSQLLAKSVTERLVQRLICGAGMLDPRFTSKFLITNHLNSKNTSLHNLEYLVRLDNLSTPTLYKTDPALKYTVIETDSDYPAGYARLRFHTSSFKIWGEFTNPNGYLRRDKIQARFIELLAQAAGMDAPNSPLQVDESVLCGIPGKILDPAALYNVLKLQCDQHVFYGPGGKVPRFPDPRDFRLAIVDEPSGIRLRVEFLSPALSNISINVRLLIVIGLDAWPNSTNFPTRVSLGHSDCLLYHQAALTGMYLVGYGVQSSAWQIRLPAAEYVLLNHYGCNSNIRSILDVLYEILEDIDNCRKSSYKILNHYILLTVLLEELEENSLCPQSDLLNWSPMYLSTHVLKLLDKIILKLQSEMQPNYFFKKSNLLVNPGHLSDEDYIIEGNNVKLYMIRLFDESLMSTKGNLEFKQIYTMQESEMVLLCKWKELIDGLLPPSGTRGRRFCFAGSRNRLDIAYTQYTTKQLDYIGMLLKNMLNVKQNVFRFDDDSCEMDHHEPVEEFLEDVIYILVTIMDQARDQYLQTQTNPNVIKNKSKIKLQFNSCTSKLVELIRKEKELLNCTLEDDLILVKVILKWLYKAVDHNKRCLAPILRPYLQNLFTTSHSVSWHLESIRQKFNDDELHALGSFARLVNNGEITPAQGLLDAVKKNWIWAKEMLEMVEKHTLRVVFVSNRGQVYRHLLSLPSYHRSESFSEIRREKTLPNRNYFNSILKQRKLTETEIDEMLPQHDQLREQSPLSLILSKRHRRGDHRGTGDIFKSLHSMHKLNLLQEISTNLPQEERIEIAELIQNLQTVKGRRSTVKKWSTTLPNLHNRISPQDSNIQKYTPKEESAGIRIKPEETSNNNINTNSLIGTCRAARIREDNSSVFLLQQNSFKIKSLLNKSESFKY